MARIVCISDTHNQHEYMNIPDGDIIIHAGDATGRGWQYEIESFIQWYSGLDFQHKIYVPGNHDIGLEENFDEWSQWFKDAGIILLTVDGISHHDWEEYEIKIHGSPITPNFGNWAFMKARGEQINKHWMYIPNDTDILVTHGPPYGILDNVGPNMWDDDISVGCEMLWKAVERIEPKIHVFGHIHEGAGQMKVGNTHFINASQLDEMYKKIHVPTVVDLK